MKIQTRIAASLMAAALFTGASSLYAQNPGQTTTPATKATTEEWNTPPAGTEQAQQGFRDGIEAAKLDKLAGRPVDPKVSHLYVHPPVKGAAQAEYRSNFENGYKAALTHAGGM